MYGDLREFLYQLERKGQLSRIGVEVDPDQEITIIQHRVLTAGGPALLFEKVKGSPYRMVTNLLGTPQRVAMACGASPAELGQRLARGVQNLMPPSFKGMWRSRRDLLRLFPVRMRRVEKGPVLETVCEPPDLMRLPVLTCWPEDGGPFFTLPLVHTVDPCTGKSNLGMYRLQRFDGRTTGMHWQIEKGGGFHFHQALRLGRTLPVSVYLGGPPALILAAVAPLPEGVDERLLAAYLMNRPLNVIYRSGTGHCIPARAEFVLEGEVRPGESRLEGPFGDHFGHYSEAADYPVLHVKRVLARRDAIFPATVVGKPVQEDYFIGEALQELTVPLLKVIRPAIDDLWAYPETGMHPLAVMAVQERYPMESLKLALGMLGEGQVSLTKVMIVVDKGVAVRDFHSVSRAVWRHLTPERMHLLAPTAQDTLDFTGPAMNVGSRLILLATADRVAPQRVLPPQWSGSSDLPQGVAAMQAIGPAFILIRPDHPATDIHRLCAALRSHTATQDYLFHVIVGDDVPLNDAILRLWGWFTRFDPALDLYPAGRRVVGNRLLLDFPITIDARWKKGYPRPVSFNPAIERRVAQRWKSYGIDLD